MTDKATLASSTREFTRPRNGSASSTENEIAAEKSTQALRKLTQEEKYSLAKFANDMCSEKGCTATRISVFPTPKLREDFFRLLDNAVASSGSTGFVCKAHEGQQSSADEGTAQRSTRSQANLGDPQLSVADDIDASGYEASADEAESPARSHPLSKNDPGV